MKKTSALAAVLFLIIVGCDQPTLFFIDPYIEESGLTYFSNSAVLAAAQGSAAPLLPIRITPEEVASEIMEGYVAAQDENSARNAIATPLLASEMYALALQYPTHNFWLLRDLDTESSTEIPPNLHSVTLSRRAAFAQLASFLDTTTDSDNRSALRVVAYRRTEREREELFYFEEQLLELGFKPSLSTYTTVLNNDAVQREQELALSDIYDIVVVLIGEQGVQVLAHGDAAQKGYWITENINRTDAERINRRIIAAINIDWIGALREIAVQGLSDSYQKEELRVEAVLEIFDSPL